MALNRRKGRADERGAALFIVVLIIVLLTALGAFAAHVTSLTQTAAGYSRRAASTLYLSEFGLNVVSTDMAGKEGDYDTKATSKLLDCRANIGLPTGVTSSCLPIEFSYIKANMLDSAIVTDADGTVFGALSRPDRPADQTIRGTLRVEMTDVGDAPDALAGAAMNGPGSIRVKRAALTTTSVLMPTVAIPGDCSQDVTRASQTQTVRGWVVYSLSQAQNTQNGVQ